MQLNLFNNLKWNEFLQKCLITANGINNCKLKQRFYSVKQQILIDYGTFDDYDIQYISNKCWSCSDGTFHFLDGSSASCNKCWGSGVYSISTYYLKRYYLNGKLFHVPEKDEPSDCVIRNKINGRIKHKNRTEFYLSGIQSAFVLLYLFDRKWFWLIIGELYIYSLKQTIKSKWKGFLKILQDNEKISFEKKADDDLPF